jgi:transcription elongation factor Elf1
MDVKVIEEKVKRQISNYFPWCPFCCFEHLDLNINLQYDSNHISCTNCGAKWKLDIQEKIRSIKLVSASINWKGRDLLDKEMEPKFWQNKAWICVITRKTPKQRF